MDVKNEVNAGVGRVNADHLAEALELNVETGEMVWRERPESHFKSKRAAKSWNTRMVGKPAFNTKKNNGYLKGGFDYIELLAHRVVWLLTHGEWPGHDIDHIDGDRTNNAPANLRSVSRAENLRNRGFAGNSCGVMGVYFHKASGLYHARIQRDGRKVSLGYFKNLGDAAAARERAKARHGFHENHGRPL